MSIDAKIHNKTLQTEFNSILKGPYTMAKWDLSLGAMMVQHLKINPCDTLH